MRLTMGLAACVLLVAAEGKDKDKKAADPLAGAWKVASLVAEGQEREQSKGSVFTFKDGKLTMKGPRGDRTSAYKLDPSKKPATIDLTAQGGQRDGQLTKGIYEVKGDELKICIGFTPDTDRPKDFTASEAGQALVTLKRDAGGKGDGKGDGKSDKP